MSAIKEIASFYKGKFTGIFQPGNKQSNGYFTIADLQCAYIRIDEYSQVEIPNIETLKTNDYWFQPRLRAKKSLPWHKKTEIFIAVREDKFYSGDLYNVLIKDLHIKYGGSENYSSVMHQDWIEISGDIWFQLEPKKKKIPPLSTIAETKSSNKGINVLPGGRDLLVEDSPTTKGMTTGNRFNFLPAPDQPTRPIIQTIQPSRPWMFGFGWALKLLAAFAIAYYLWQYSPLLSGIFLGAALLYGIVRLLWRNQIFRSIISFILVAFLIYFLYSIIYRDGIKGDPVKTRTGRVKMDPPVRDDGDQQQGPDYSISKQIEWYDFISRFYSAQYKTSQTAFDKSVAEQERLSQSISFKTSQQFFTQFYEGLYQIDRQKIQQVATIFRDSARIKNLNQIEVAEMVVTFIQEIPYYLVHDGTCQMAIQSENDFMREYHRAKKPCISNIKGGVQSPYEFLHNLKGDCDTRSLLGFTILTEMKIPCSVWVSEVYGHSILGVGVPVGHGIFKSIEGVKHYGVELTAKGFRLGMVAPENARSANWDITIYNNQL